MATCRGCGKVEISTFSCTGADAEQVRELLAEVSSEDGATWQDVKIIVRARKAQTA